LFLLITAGIPTYIEPWGRVLLRKCLQQPLPSL
jgi:hypothetical protein